MVKHFIIIVILLLLSCEGSTSAIDRFDNEIAANNPYTSKATTVKDYDFLCKKEYDADIYFPATRKLC